MPSSLKFDHAILAVNDLQQAQKDFEALGFTVFYGGQHADGKTENCLIVFQDSTYIELIGLVDASALDDPAGMHAQLFGPGEGWAGYALLADDLEQEVQAMRDRGVAVVGPSDNSRARPDGERVAWRAAMLADSMTPFFIQDRTPRTMRVTDDERTQHANGVTGVARVVVAVPELQAAITLYSQILGETAAPSSLQLPDATTADFALASTTLTLAAPTSPDSALHDLLQKRGSTIYMLRLVGTGMAVALDVSHTHSARLELIESDH